MTFSMKCTCWFVKHEAMLKWLVGDRINKLGYQCDSVSCDRPQLCPVHSCLFTHRTKRLEVAGLVSEFPRLPLCDFNVVNCTIWKRQFTVVALLVHFLLKSSSHESTTFVANTYFFYLHAYLVVYYWLHIKLVLQVFIFFFVLRCCIIY